MSTRNDHVISCGAAGSKVFTRFLYSDVDPAQAMRFHHHTRVPPQTFEPQIRYIYLFSDPRNAILSFFWRRLKKHSNHGAANQPSERTQWDVNEKDWACRHLHNLGCDSTTLNPDWNLAEYLSNTTKDIFCLEEHFDNWLASTDHELLFIRYESLWQQEDRLKKILSLPDSSLPTFIPRAVDWRLETPEVQQGLNRLYGGFADRLASLPDVFGQFGFFEHILANHTKQVQRTRKL